MCLFFISPNINVTRRCRLRLGGAEMLSGQLVVSWVYCHLIITVPWLCFGNKQLMKKQPAKRALKGNLKLARWQRKKCSRRDCLGARNFLIRNRNVCWLGCAGCGPLLPSNRNQIGKMITQSWNPLKTWNFFDEVRQSSEKVETVILRLKNTTYLTFTDMCLRRVSFLHWLLIACHLLVRLKWPSRL